MSECSGKSHRRIYNQCENEERQRVERPDVTAGSSGVW